MTDRNTQRVFITEEVELKGLYPDKIRSLPLFNGDFDAYKLSAENCEVLFASYPAGTIIDPHCHDTENHGVITRGELVLTFSGKRHTYSIGDWYHIPAGLEHQADIEVDTDTIELWFKTES